MAGHRDSLRDYIYRNDRKLYSAITNYERRADLPSDIGMTKRSERVLSRLQRAAAQNGFEGMSQSERRSVVGKLTRPRKQFLKEKTTKIVPTNTLDLVSPVKPPAGTEPISKEEFANAAGSTPPSLPESPPRLWPGRQRGRPSAESYNLLISFLEETYGAFLPANKNVLREYIGKHDPRLLQAVRNYERRSALPGHLEMPSVHDKFAARMAMAKAAGYPGFTEAQISRAEAHLTRAARPTENDKKLHPMARLI